MKRSDIYPLPPYFGRYISLCDDVEMERALQLSIQELNEALLDLWHSLGERVYAPGKWTVKEILQHLIDAERIFIYRALVYSRGEKQKVISFDENTYAENSGANHRKLEDLVHELKHCHESATMLFSSLNPETLSNQCIGFSGEYPVGSVPFILAGHQRWHFNILQERYYPLLAI